MSRRSVISYRLGRFFFNSWISATGFSELGPGINKRFFASCSWWSLVSRKIIDFFRKWSVTWWWRNHNFPMYFPYILKIFYVWIRPIRYTGVTEQGYKWSKKTFCSRLRYHSTNFLKVENLRFTWTGYGDDVIDHFRKKSIVFRDTRDHQEHDSKNRLPIPGPSPEKSVAEIDQLKKNDLSSYFPVRLTFSWLITTNWRKGKFSINNIRISCPD